jgi:uncharacterized protein
VSSLLLDVNVLVAIAWPQHVHHRQARSWFISRGNLGWATSPMTESGFIRVSSNPRVVTEARTPAEAADLLRALRNAGSWEFWIDDVQMSASLEGVMGYRQVTDAHLLQLAQQRGGAVATFDAGLAALAATRGQTVELIPS